ncbi:hypothetical protein B0T11DRAFT_71106 [Plectosphaerella cucumerina]|uniref:Uncharacterized protein n=1 Tax=Plectosphaerella cucumerina TaxID=40658 RepID=A0A8K0X8M3_9PEZI|nr:hypothetical protein B0T11DRAFT_71106 [Plectosphaerella cucumerina]
MTRAKSEADAMSDSLESLETKSSMSGSANSMINQPRPFSVILMFTLFWLLMASIGGLSTSAVDFRTPTRAPGSVTQSFVMFSSLISPVYIFLHIFVASRNLEVIRRQPLQSPFVSWTVIVARIGFLLWVVTIILTSVTVARPASNNLITRSNVAIAVFGVICLSVLILSIEVATDPFELPFMPRRQTVSCLVSSFEGDLKRDLRRYRTMTMDSTSSRGSSRSNSRKRYSPPAPSCKRCTVILEEEEGPGTPRAPETCHVPPGTAWASDWEALAEDAGVQRNGSVSDTGTSASGGAGPADAKGPGGPRQPPPAIVVTNTPG